MSQSKWDSIGSDSAEECSRLPRPYKPDSLRSWVHESDKLLDENRREYIFNASVQYERDQEKAPGASSARGPACWSCYSGNARLRCGRCKLAYFCNRECQQNGWKAHKFQCRQTTEDEARQVQQKEEWNELLSRRARQEELEYGPRCELGPVQKLMMEDAATSSFQKPPLRDDGNLKFAVIIPFRQQSPLQDRGPQLQRLVAHLHDAFVQLRKWGCARAWRILVVEQSDDGRPFNRGALLNAGVDFLSRSREKWDQLVLHDVDLLANNDNTKIWYAVDVPKGYIVHLSAEGYAKYQGHRALKGTLRGVVAARWDDFEESGGFPLDIWGWAEGLEDRLWMERLGALRIRYYPCPVGEWQDLDTVDLRTSVGAAGDPRDHYDERWLRCQLPGGPVPTAERADGGALPGPAAPRDSSPEGLLEWLTARTGGLGTEGFYTVLCEGPCHVHATRIEVALDARRCR